MLPRLQPQLAIDDLYVAFLAELRASGFEGDISPDYSDRTVLATDNSIYQMMPQAVVYPKHKADVERITNSLNKDKYRKVVLSPRGGGTGTNGQSLTDGIVVDISKHMNNILEINAEEGWARVETGVVKDQLNAELKKHGLFFAPELSTSNRATIGGMINTDASGQGSVLYGKTRDHVIELETVLLSGDLLKTHSQTVEEVRKTKQQSNRVHRVLDTVESIHHRRKEDIEKKFPPLNRCLTGYDLAHIYDEQNQLNLNNILCGSEGTLGFIVEAKLNVLKIPKFSALVNVFYDSFEASLRDAQRLMTAKPTSIETIDSTVLELAMGDASWHTVEEYFNAEEQAIDGINLVEYTADSEEELKAGIDRISKLLIDPSAEGTSIGYSVAHGSDAVKRIWTMRKKAVGLLGNAKSEARPVPFVEDTAVPPENLADFIMEFRSVLDREKLFYGMFGHVDAGVLHVRPALDLKDKDQMKTVRRVTDEVVELVKKYNGLLWGEHGKGVRSEFAPAFFGDLYPELQAIKKAFDPHNQLNPGKIATHDASARLFKIDEVTTRGDFDRTIATDNWQHFKDGMYCNGNGACYNYDFNDPMCPSWKVTRDRKHSPKGRASLVREWLRLLSDRGTSAEALAKREKFKFPLFYFIPRAWRTFRNKPSDDFNHDVADAMYGCLACKSCTSQCPIKVDVPEFRARFLQIYYGRYLRPLKDYFIGTLEFIIPLLARAPFRYIYNGLMKAPPVKALLASVAGMVDSPLIQAVNFSKALRKRKLHYADASMLMGLSESERQKSVVIVQDAFTRYFDTQVVVDIIDALSVMGFRVWVMPYQPNGKPLHVHGFLHTFRWIATRNQKKLKEIADTGVPMIGIDPSMTLTYRAEYAKYVDAQVPQVQLIQEFLADNLDQLSQVSHQFNAGTAKLLGHCTEKTNAAPAMQAWTTIFTVLNQTLEQIPVGCCGMAGTYGHETRNKENSRKIYAQSWEPAMQQHAQSTLLATGYSCRSQVKRFDGKLIAHPLQFLLQQHQS